MSLCPDVRGASWKSCMSSVTLRWLSKKCKVANKQGNEAKPSLARAKTRTPPERVGKDGVSGTLMQGDFGRLLEGPLGQHMGAPEVPDAYLCRQLLANPSISASRVTCRI